jgi:hypothetical protein
MKYLLSIAIFLTVTITSYSQSLGYQDLSEFSFHKTMIMALLVITAMSGAFGALGVEMYHAINVNPAGICSF